MEKAANLSNKEALANVIQYFKDKGIVFAPSNLYWDVKKSISAIHKGGLIHRDVIADVDRYLYLCVCVSRPSSHPHAPSAHLR